MKFSESTSGNELFIEDKDGKPLLIASKSPETERSDSRRASVFGFIVAISFFIFRIAYYGTSPLRYFPLKDGFTVEQVSQFEWALRSLQVICIEAIWSISVWFVACMVALGYLAFRDLKRQGVWQKLKEASKNRESR